MSEGAPTDPTRDDRTGIGAGLAELADAYGVATTYQDWARRERPASPIGVRAALLAMGVPVGTPAETDHGAVAEALEALRRREPDLVPPSVVARTDQATAVPLAAGSDRVRALLRVDGAEQPLDPSDGRLVVPAGLPVGAHRLVVEAAERGADVPLLVTPPRCPVPPDLRQRKGWGWMLQLYQLRSAASWGMGDLGDLAELVRWTGTAHGADFVMVNPLHAANPGLPQQASPYYPSSRRYRNPLYLRLADVPELADLSPADRGRIASLEQQARGGDPDRIDRDRVYQAKMEALELLHALPLRPGRQEALEAFRQAEGAGLADFATFCALAEQHGTPWRDWPEHLRHPRSPGVDAARRELADRVAFHTWVQWLCDEQLEAVAAAATDADMAIGVVHDLAVGVDPGGADAWALQDDLAGGVTVGAPPDEFNQRGQDWSLPPLRPDRLAATAYAPFRDMVRTVLRHAGGIRIDHVMGLWRLWWVPEGHDPAHGTYVRYPAEDLTGVLAMEAEATGALVIGEDLGTVEDAIRTSMAASDLIGSRVLYFERVDPDPDRDETPRRLRSDEYPEPVMASVTTHDLPTAAGWWHDVALEVQIDLGLLPDTADPDAERARTARERDELRELLAAEGLVAPQEEGTEALVLAMHAFLARCPAVLLGASLADAVGDLRQPNMPGTDQEYPSWRLPIADGEGVPVSLEALVEHPGVRRLADTISAGRRAAAAGRPPTAGGPATDGELAG